MLSEERAGDSVSPVIAAYEIGPNKVVIAKS